MKKLLSLYILLSLVACADNETVVSDTSEKPNARLKAPSFYYPKEKTQVLVVGTFHFDYPGMDAFKSDEEDKIDVLKEPKKSEVAELVDYIKKFNPTKIAIEARPDWEAMEKFKKYKAGEFRNERDERFQLAMKVAADINLDTLYGIDAPSFDADLMQLDSVYFQKLFQDFDFQSEDPYMKMTMKWLEEDDKVKSKVPLLEYFKHMNSRESHNYGYGAYLIGDFKLGNSRGADVLSIWWYNRNLRIFRKLQEITEDKDDRILVIFGNGHAAILRQLLEASPEYDFVEFANLK